MLPTTCAICSTSLPHVKRTLQIVQIATVYVRLGLSRVEQHQRRRIDLDRVLKVLPTGEEAERVRQRVEQARTTP